MLVEEVFIPLPKKVLGTESVAALRTPRALTTNNKFKQWGKIAKTRVDPVRAQAHIV